MNPSARLTLGAFASEARVAHVATDELLARRGDASSFAELYERHLPAVFRYLSGRLRSREEAEDLTSEVFRHAWSSRRTYRGRGSFRAWIFSIVRRTLADHYRRPTSVPHVELSLAERVLDNQLTPEDQAVQDEREREVRRLLTGLSPQQQEILGLRFAAELTYAGSRGISALYAGPAEHAFEVSCPVVDVRWERYPTVSTIPLAKTWLQIQADLGLAANTVEAYGRALQDYLAFSVQLDVLPEIANRAHIAEYVRDLPSRPSRRGATLRILDSGAGLANATLQQRLTAVRLFHDYLIEEGVRTDNPVGRGRYTPGKGFGGARERGINPALPQTSLDPVRRAVAGSVGSSSN